MPGRKTERSATEARLGRVLPSAGGGWVPTMEPTERADDEPPTSEPASGEARGGAGARADPAERVPTADAPDLRAALRAAVAARLPAHLSGARVNPGRRGWRALVVVALIAALVSGGIWWRARSVPTAIQPAAVSSAPASVSSGVSGSGAATPAGIVVDVAGKVKHPGIVDLPAGSRVYDAIKAAGGLRRGASTAGLNLARKLVDGEQIVVGKPVAASQGVASGAPGATGGVPGGKIDLNAATLQQLDGLPGVGPVLAQRILDYRDKHGGFRSVAQLKDVSGIGDARYADIAPKVQI